MLNFKNIDLNTDIYIKIDNNIFFCDQNYLSYIEKNLNQEKYSSKSNLFFYRWINNPDKFEKSERELIAKHLPKDAIVLELGGFIGTTACLINSIVEDKKSHTVSEINSFFRDYLEKNKLLNLYEFKIIDKIEYLNDTMIYNSIVCDIEGDEYLFILNNQEYIKKYIKLIIVEFHSTYTCKNNKKIGKKAIEDTKSFLNKHFQKVAKKGKTVIYKKYE